MIDTTHATPELFAALAQAQIEVENADKTSDNPHYRSKYADLAEVLNTVRPVFAKHGLSLIQSTGFDGSVVSVTTLLGHSTGGFLTSTAACVPAKTDAQGVGAATTYLRRYSLSAMCGIAQEDDDGEAAAHTGKPQQVSKAVTPKPKPEPQISEAEAVQVTDWMQTIHECADPTRLDKIGADIASSSLSAGAKAKLRAAFASHKHSLRKAA